jgi:hypothetical protein
MSKFKVTATLTTTRTVSKTVEANDLNDAAKKLLNSVNIKD